MSPPLPGHAWGSATPTLSDHPPLVPTGKYQEAGTHVQEALHLAPSSEAAQARRGLLQLKKGDMSAATRDLQHLAETDARDLTFLLRLLESPEQQSLTQVHSAHKPHASLAPVPQAWATLPFPLLAIILGYGLRWSKTSQIWPGKLSRNHPWFFACSCKLQGTSAGPPHPGTRPRTHIRLARPREGVQVQASGQVVRGTQVQS